MLRGSLIDFRLDDPAIWGQDRLNASEAQVCRWTLTAEDICFKGPVMSYFFRLGKSEKHTQLAATHLIGSEDIFVDSGIWLHLLLELMIL